MTFISSLPEQTLNKQLRMSPAELVKNKRFGRLGPMWRKKARERKKKHVLKLKEYEKLLEGKYHFLRKTYNHRVRCQRERRFGCLAGCAKDCSLHPYEGKPPKWYKLNNVFSLSLDEWYRCWEALESLHGLTYRDRGIGRKDRKHWWYKGCREWFGNVKFGRRDRTKPFEMGNIQFYTPVKKNEREKVLSEGYMAPAGLWRVSPCASPEDYSVKLFHDAQAKGQLVLLKDRLILLEI